MPTRDAAPIGAPCWIDVMTSEPDRIQTFYSEIFGWTVEDPGPDYGGYFDFHKDGIQVAGGMKNAPDSGVPDLWSVYLAVEDADATVEAATANGGSAVVPAMDVMELGRMAVLIDAGGAGIGIWQPGLHTGFGVLGEVGTPVHFELHARDYDASVAFYRDVFDWDPQPVAEDTPGFRYATHGEGEGQMVGIMDASGFLPEGVPPFWSIYFAVDDVDKTLAQIAELGGSTMFPAEDTPYGRLATASDPTGASFRLRSEV